MARQTREFQIRCRLRVLRAERDITQEDLASAVRVTRQTIISLEKDDYAPSLLLAYALARYFGKSIEEIFPLEE
jgi:putative transcriptional regulator